MIAFDGDKPGRFLLVARSLRALILLLKWTDSGNGVVLASIHRPIRMRFVRADGWLTWSLAANMAVGFLPLTLSGGLSGVLAGDWARWPLGPLRVR